MTQTHGQPDGQNRIGPLEHRCRLLLRAYPAQYRSERGEEIVGTLLEATPQGRAWPLARDVRGLVTGGLRARAALNGQRATAENMRVAVLTGVSAYLAYTAASSLVFAVALRRMPPPQGPQAFGPAWLHALAAALIAAAVAAVWFARHWSVRLAAIIAAAVVWSFVPPWQAEITEVACLAALAQLAVRRQAPGWRWGWPVVPAAAFPALAAAGLLPESVTGFNFYWLTVAVGAVSLLWAVIDARAAVAASVFLSALYLPVVLSAIDRRDAAQAAMPLVFVTLLAVMVWWLHRQSARGTARRDG